MKIREYHLLPIYKECMMFANKFSVYTSHTKRVLKYGKVNDIYNSIVELIEIIAYTVEFYNEKAERLSLGIDKIREIRIKTRILYDLNGLTLKQFSDMSVMEDNIYRQLIGWHKSMMKERAAAEKAKADSKESET